MKIYFYTYPVAFQCPGGGEIQLLKSKEALERRGHEVVLFDQWQHSLEDADVVHQFSVQGGVYNLCAYVQAQEIPLVLSPILWLSEYISQYPMSEISFMTNAADVICPNSTEEVERFIKHFDAPKEKYIVTHNGIDQGFFEPVPGDLFRQAFEVEGAFILCVGNIETRKNQRALLEASKLVNIPVILVGNIRDAEYFKKLELDFDGGFRYIGVIEHDSDLLKSAYAACDVFALPSLLETPGLAALEAAACGANIVITQEGCTREYFGDMALYVDPKNVDDIALKLGLSMKRSTPGAAESVLRYSWDSTALELEAAYQRAIASKKG
ncbi:glycosyltransferase [Ketobacter sp. MCCC 1A13808]|uniref:glycosyltransferase n=1 Tax=Ketobacter sp. MCCC 1A13808 TaxID=2602738 RepID=UPI0012ECA5CE|nr:glycosyltransferase [Ketobacter sp. MCCC 1A13808]MVF13751.1 glycosyltransferase [Ketobacter sp. MCCC 1A13808]